MCAAAARSMAATTTACCLESSSAVRCRSLATRGNAVLVRSTTDSSSSVDEGGGIAKLISLSLLGRFGCKDAQSELEGWSVIITAIIVQC